MSKAFLCDGCGDFISGYPKLVKNWYNTNCSWENLDDTSEYCDECNKKQKKVLAGIKYES